MDWIVPKTSQSLERIAFGDSDILVSLEDNNKYAI